MRLEEIQVRLGRLTGYAGRPERRAALGEFTDLDGAAEFLGLKPRTVRAMAGRDIPVYCVGPRGGRLKFKVADLRGYIESRRRSTGRVPADQYRTRLMGREDGKPAQFI